MQSACVYLYEYQLLFNVFVINGVDIPAVGNKIGVDIPAVGNKTGVGAVAVI